MPFREAHLLIGAAVRRSVAERRTLADLSLEEWRRISELFDDEVLGLFDVDAALSRRELPGGPGTALGRTRPDPGHGDGCQDPPGRRRVWAPPHLIRLEAGTPMPPGRTPLT